MYNLTCVIRLLPVKRTNLHLPVYLHSTGWRGKDKNDEEDSSKPRVKAKNEEALNKLNTLLKQMVENDLSSAAEKLNLAKPKRTREAKTVREQEQTLEKQVLNAAKDVAHSLGGDVKQTESELLTKLLTPSSAENTVDKQTVSANLSEIVKGMKIDRESKTMGEVSRANQVRALLQHVKSKATQQDQKEEGDKFIRRRNVRADRFVERISTEKVDLFGNEPLGFFSIHDKPQEEMNKTWKMLHERELALVVTHPPSNYFQQMILWTQQGKLWKFPIDNEQGMEEEQNIYFTEHIFLEKHLEPWCPPKGPIRHFMELVCVGLSKNPYMSVEDKRGHIAWYRDYFTDKKQLLHEVGAIPPGFEFDKPEENVEKLE